MDLEVPATVDNNFLYFSYARADDGPYLRKFYEDLEPEIRGLTGLPRAQIAFLDRNDIALGAVWDAVIDEQLRTCRVFVPLYSASYVQSAHCGKELAVFRERLHHYQQQQALPIDDTLILPVLWSPGEFLKTIGQFGLSYTDDDYPEEYAREGMLQLVKLGATPNGKYYIEYFEFIRKFAVKIVDSARRVVLPPLETPLASLDKVESVFLTTTPPSPSSSPAGAPTIIQSERDYFTIDTLSKTDSSKAPADGSHTSKLTEPSDSTKPDQPLVFICYRREDSADITGRIYDSLVQRFGHRAIFKDVDSIPLGVDFKRYLEKQVEQCNVLLAVIGKSWLKKRAGKRRLDDPKDYVRIEIASALQRGIPVIPLMVSNARMPAEADLPDDLSNLVFRNFLQIRSDPDFHNDVNRLIKELEPPSPMTATDR